MTISLKRNWKMRWKGNWCPQERVKWLVLIPHLNQHFLKKILMHLLFDQRKFWRQPFAKLIRKGSNSLQWINKLSIKKSWTLQLFCIRLYIAPLWIVDKNPCISLHSTCEELSFSPHPASYSLCVCRRKVTHFSDS